MEEVVAARCLELQFANRVGVEAGQEEVHIRPSSGMVEVPEVGWCSRYCYGLEEGQMVVRIRLWSEQAEDRLVD